jgi:excisionase family DNA binding protein
MSDKFYTTYQVAEMCNVSPGSVIRWIHEGKIKASLTAGGHHRIDREEILNLLKSLRMPIPAVLHDDSQVRVLLVDDDDTVRQLMRTIFNLYFPEVLVEEAEDGFAAGTRLLSFRPDMVVLDLRLPGLDGFRVCQYIRETPEFKHIKVLAVSGDSVLEVRDRILSVGADDFLAKPFENGELVAKIRNLLGSQAKEMRHA